MNIKNLLLGNIEQEELLNYYNVTLRYTSFPCNSIRGFIDYYDGIYFIYINKNLNYYKKRWTLLHELAHIELSHLCQSNKDLFCLYVGNYEEEVENYLIKLKQECFNK